VTVARSVAVHDGGAVVTDEFGPPQVSTGTSRAVADPLPEAGVCTRTHADTVRWEAPEGRAGEGFAKVKEDPDGRLRAPVGLPRRSVVKVGVVPVVVKPDRPSDESPEKANTVSKGPGKLANGDVARDRDAEDDANASEEEEEEGREEEGIDADTPSDEAVTGTPECATYGKVADTARTAAAAAATCHMRTEVLRGIVDFSSIRGGGYYVCLRVMMEYQHTTPPKYALRLI